MRRNPMYRWLALFMNGMVGKDFEAGLANLKALAQAKWAPATLWHSARRGVAA
jgi:hypothetical protein